MTAFLVPAGREDCRVGMDAIAILRALGGNSLVGNDAPEPGKQKIRLLTPASTKDDMRKVLIFAGLSEIGFGLLLLAMPQLAARLLLATNISGEAVTAGRLVGVGLIVLGVGCWPRGNSLRESYIMLVWSVLAACSLAAVGVRWSAGVLLWPALVIHSAIALLLCISLPRGRSV